MASEKCAHVLHAALYAFDGACSEDLREDTKCAAPGTVHSGLHRNETWASVGVSARAIIPLLGWGFSVQMGFQRLCMTNFATARLKDTSLLPQGMKTLTVKSLTEMNFLMIYRVRNLWAILVEITGSTKTCWRVHHAVRDNRTTQAICGTFRALNELADFDAQETDKPNAEEKPQEEISAKTSNNLPTPPQLKGQIILSCGWDIQS